MTRVAVAFGSSLGDRAGHLDHAAARLREFLTNLKVSRYHETAPVDVPVPSGAFLNAAAVGETTLSAHQVLDRLLAIEAERGRERPFVNAPRTLDLDLILFGEETIDEPGLAVPHPRFRERIFVLAPLAEVAADMRDPLTRKTIAELLSSALR